MTFCCAEPRGSRWSPPELSGEGLQQGCLGRVSPHPAVPAPACGPGRGRTCIVGRWERSTQLKAGLGAKFRKAGQGKNTGLPCAGLREGGPAAAPGGGSAPGPGGLAGLVAVPSPHCRRLPEPGAVLRCLRGRQAQGGLRSPQPARRNAWLPACRPAAASGSALKPDYSRQCRIPRPKWGGLAGMGSGHCIPAWGSACIRAGLWWLGAPLRLGPSTRHWDVSGLAGSVSTVSSSSAAPGTAPRQATAEPRGFGGTAGGSPVRSAQSSPCHRSPDRALRHRGAHRPAAGSCASPQPGGHPGDIRCAVYLLFCRTLSQSK